MWKTSDGRNWVGRYNTETNEITMTSGYIATCENGYVWYLNEWCLYWRIT